MISLSDFFNGPSGQSRHEVVRDLEANCRRDHSFSNDTTGLTGHRQGDQLSAGREVPCPPTRRLPCPLSSTTRHRAWAARSTGAGDDVPSTKTSLAAATAT